MGWQFFDLIVPEIKSLKLLQSRQGWRQIMNQVLTQFQGLQIFQPEKRKKVVATFFGAINKKWIYDFFALVLNFFFIQLSIRSNACS